MTFSLFCLLSFVEARSHVSGRGTSRWPTELMHVTPGGKHFLVRLWEVIIDDSINDGVDGTA